MSDGLGFHSQESPCGSDLGTESVGQVPSYHNGTYTAFVYAEKIKNIYLKHRDI